VCAGDRPPDRRLVGLVGGGARCVDASSARRRSLANTPPPSASPHASRDAASSRLTPSRSQRPTDGSNERVRLDATRARAAAAVGPPPPPPSSLFACCYCSNNRCLSANARPTAQCPALCRLPRAVSFLLLGCRLATADRCSDDGSFTLEPHGQRPGFSDVGVHLPARRFLLPPAARPPTRAANRGIRVGRRRLGVRPADDRPINVVQRSSASATAASVR
jgi:hypothetical protein